MVRAAILGWKRAWDQDPWTFGVIVVGALSVASLQHWFSDILSALLFGSILAWNLFKQVFWYRDQRDRLQIETDDLRNRVDELGWKNHKLEISVATLRKQVEKPMTPLGQEPSKETRS